MAKILVVDDHQDSREVFAELLKMRGHQVTVARDGIEAEALIAHRTPDLVLTDLLLPDRDGFELIKRVRVRWPKVRIIAMSGGWHRPERPEGTLGLLEDAKALGADVTLRKPVEIDALFQALERLLPDP